MAVDLSNYAPFFQITIGGKSQPDLQKMITSIVVDERLDSPCMFKFSLSLGQSMKTLKFMLLDNPLFDPMMGQEVQIFMGYINNPKNPKWPSISGKIVALNPNFPSSGVPSLSIDGYDHSFFMQKTTTSNCVRYDKCQNFLEVLSQIALSNGLMLGETSYKLRSRSPIPPGDDQGDYAYLRFMAEKTGFEFFVRNRIVHFRDPKFSTLPTATLTWGKELIDFTPRMSTAKVVKKVTVQYSNNRLGSEKPFKGIATSADLGLIEQGALSAVELFKDKGEEFLEWPVGSDAEAKSIAKAVLIERNNSLIEGTCECIGMPWIRPGMNVKIAGVGRRFGGRYYVTGSRHSIGDGGFTTSLDIRRGAVGSFA